MTEEECVHEWTQVGFADSVFGRVTIFECKLCEAAQLAAEPREDDDGSEEAA
jgi:hypothetical protein